jgi:hypothetical protein
MPKRTGFFEDLGEFLQDEMGYGNMWDAQLEQLAVREAEKRASDIDRLNEYNRRNPEKHRAAVKKALANKRERAIALFGLAEAMYGELPCKSCGKPLTVTDLQRNKCYNCKQGIKP